MTPEEEAGTREGGAHMKASPAMRKAFAGHRLTWDRRASFHLARHVHGDDWRERLVSWIWLIGERVPFDGRA